MALEAANYISQLVPTNPPGTDQAATTDDHLRVIKRAVYQTFPNLNGVVNCTPAQLNGLTGLGNNLIVFTTASGLLSTSTYTAASLSRISNALTGSMALVSGADGDIESHATVSATELGYLDGVTSNIQTQLDSKGAAAHDHSGGGELPIVSGSLAAGAVIQSKISTSVMSWSGNNAGGRTDFTVSGYGFFPMVYVSSSGALNNEFFMTGHTTDGGSADVPRFSLGRPVTKGSTTLSYAVDWRYIDAA